MFPGKDAECQEKEHPLSRVAWTSHFRSTFCGWSLLTLFLESPSSPYVGWELYDCLWTLAMQIPTGESSVMFPSPLHSGTLHPGVLVCAWLMCTPRQPISTRSQSWHAARYHIQLSTQKQGKGRTQRPWNSAHGMRMLGATWALAALSENMGSLSFQRLDPEKCDYIRLSLLLWYEDTHLQCHVWSPGTYGCPFLPYTGPHIQYVSSIHWFYTLPGKLMHWVPDTDLLSSTMHLIFNLTSRVEMSH